MKLTIEELNILTRSFVSKNKEYLLDNITNMESLPEVIEMFKPTGWTIEEYQEYIRSNQTEEDTFIEQLLQLGIPEDELIKILEELDRE